MVAHTSHTAPRSTALAVSLLTQLLLLGLLPAAESVTAESLTIEPRLWHLRQQGGREWDAFPEQPEAAILERSFQLAELPPADGTLQVRQQDVKQGWGLELNGEQLGKLVVDENDQTVYFSVPRRLLRTGANQLKIASTSPTAPPDDIRVGAVVWHPLSRETVLGGARLQVEVSDERTGTPLPCRLTVLTAAGSLQTVLATPTKHLAVRAGVVYTATGTAEFDLPPGDYQLFAGRGFEYSLASAQVRVTSGVPHSLRFTLRREVPTDGWVACDPHVHTLTRSGHGDATLTERMVTLAGEGIELPVATDHNVHVDYEPLARQVGVRSYFTPVMGCEVTTRVGHFNVFPVAEATPPVNAQLTDWQTLFPAIYATPGLKIAILNHARDLHGGTRPFGPERFHRVSGEQLTGWPMRFNGMEVINSGATQTEPLRLCHDWMHLLNRGLSITPVGSSDSHDVARHFVGQGRTYIRCDDRDVATIDVDDAVSQFLAGRVRVSYGLLTELTVNGKYGPGEFGLLPSAEEIVARVRVLAPHWLAADRITLFANGVAIREEPIPSRAATLPTGVHWQGEWRLPRPSQDLHLVAIATGPGVSLPYWATAKPYQPTSASCEPRVMGCSGAVWIDGDDDGIRSSALDYARRAWEAADGDWQSLVRALDKFDPAVSVQVAGIAQQHGEQLLQDSPQAALRGASPPVQQAFREYLEAWRDSQQPR